MVKVNVIQVQPLPEGDAAVDGNCRLPRRHSRRLASTRGLASNNEFMRRRQQETLPAVENTRHASDSFLEKLRFFERDVDACDVKVAEQTPRQGEPDGDEDSGVVEEEVRPQKRRSAVALGVGCGWVRVFSGEDERGALVYLTLDTTASDVCRDLLLQEDDAIWLQYGGGAARRLRAKEAPLSLQDALLRGLGYLDATRRARLGIDPELRHLLRFSVGPSMPRPGLVLGGPLYVLKGLVFPQWRRRNVAIVAGRMLIFPATDGKPEEVVLSGGDVNERTPKAGRLVLRVTEYLDGLQPRHVFLGFLRPSDKDIWYSWLTKCYVLKGASRPQSLLIALLITVLPEREESLQNGACLLTHKALANNAPNTLIMVRSFLLVTQRMSNMNLDLT